MSDSETLAERFARQARQWVGAAGTATERIARAGRLQLDCLAIRRERARELQALGERYLELLERGGEGRPGRDSTVEQIRRRIADLDATLRGHEAEIDRIRAVAGPDRGAPR